MKTIEQAAKENSEKAGYNPKIASDIVGKTVYECAFKAGVIFSQRWIPVSEELPPKEKDTDESEVVLIMENNNRTNIILGWYDYHQKKWFMIYKLYKINPSHWRPISFL